MKVGILTFHWSRNYGAALQSYALKTYIYKMGYKVNIIDYIPNYPKAKSSFISELKGFILFKLLVFDALKIKKQKKQFKEFSDSFFSKDILDVKSTQFVEKKYDCLICGSDQIWNPFLTGGNFDPAYFGKLKGINTKFCASYAASIGEKHIPKEQVNRFKLLINSLKYISVREEQSVNEVQQYTSSKVIDVIDPTLLLDYEDYSSISIDPNITKPYLLIYQNTKNPLVYQIASKVAKEKNLKIVEVAYRRQFSFINEKIIMSAGPREFLGLYKNADYVITNTFHGTVFSIIFNKDFISIPLKGREDRVLNLTNKLKLEKRLISTLDCERIENLISEQINYNDVKKLLEKEKTKSKKFLEGMLENNDISY